MFDICKYFINVPIYKLFAISSNFKIISLMRSSNNIILLFDQIILFSQLMFLDLKSFN